MSKMSSMPTEILINIFIYLPAKDLTKCREVCVRWASVIDELKSDDLWSQYCKEDFNNIYQDARRKAKPGLLWYNLYRSLTLWKKLDVSRETVDEIFSVYCLDEEIRNFEILNNGVFGLHKKSSIEYYDIHTRQLTRRESITGDYLRYTENDDVIVMLSSGAQCILLRKALFRKSQEESKVIVDYVKLYTLAEDALYFVNMDEEIFKCNLNNRKLRPILLKQLRECIMSVSYSNGRLNILTFERNIYSIVGDNLEYKCTLCPGTNLLNQIKKYELFEQLDWHVFFQWLVKLNNTVPDEPLRDIVFIRSYGDIFFVGTNWGVLRIYHSPYLAGEFDIFNSQPLKEYNFVGRADYPAHSMCPILQVDVLEVEDGHTVLVAMPKKMVVLNITSLCF